MLNRDRLILLGVILAAVLIYVIPMGGALSTEAQQGLSVLVFAAGLWVLAPIPLQITGLLIPVALVLTGILEVREAFAPFASPVVFLILGSLFLAEAMRKHGLTRRLALSIIIRCEGRPRLMLLALMVFAALTSMWVFSTAVVAMLIPVCLAISSRVDDEHRSEFVSVLLMSLVLATTLGALSTILGASSNAIASASLAEEQPWSFFDWMKYGFPLALGFVPLTWFIMVNSVFPDVSQFPIDEIKDQIQTDDNITSKEQGILAILGLAIVFWVLGPPVAESFGINSGLVHSAVISITAAGLLFVLDIISWPDARQVNWGVYLIIGAGLSLGRGLHASGLSVSVGDFISGLVQGWWYPFTAGLMILFTALISNAVNNTTVVAILAPLIADMAMGMGFTAPKLMLPMAFGASYGFIVPSASSRTALIHASGEIDQWFMMKVGTIITVPLVILTVLYFWVLSTLGWL